MSEITPINRPSASILSRPDRLNHPGSASASPVRGSDKVELSPTAQLLSKLKALPDVRRDLIDRVRAEIASGTYDTPDKVNAVLASEGLAEDLI